MIITTASNIVYKHIHHVRHSDDQQFTGPYIVLHKVLKTLVGTLF